MKPTCHGAHSVPHLKHNFNPLLLQLSVVSSLNLLMRGLLPVPRIHFHSQQVWNTDRSIKNGPLVSTRSSVDLRVMCDLTCSFHCWCRALGTPLAWPEAKENAAHVREWGIEVCVKKEWHGSVGYHEG